MCIFNSIFHKNSLVPKEVTVQSDMESMDRAEKNFKHTSTRIWTCKSVPKHIDEVSFQKRRTSLEIMIHVCNFSSNILFSVLIGFDLNWCVSFTTKSDLCREEMHPVLTGHRILYARCLRPLYSYALPLQEREKSE